MNKQSSLSTQPSRNLLGFFPPTLLILLIAFNFYKGITVQEIGIPGFTIRFFPQETSLESGQSPTTKSNSGSVSEVDPEQEDSQTEVALRQEQLESELRDLRQELENREQPEDEFRVANLTGTWQILDGSEIHVISQTGNAVVVQVVESSTQTIVAIGQGTIDQNEVNISYDTIFGAAQGYLDISSNHQQMKGTFQYTLSGQTFSTVLVKVG